MSTVPSHTSASVNLCSHERRLGRSAEMLGVGLTERWRQHFGRVIRLFRLTDSGPSGGEERGKHGLFLLDEYIGFRDEEDHFTLARTGCLLRCAGADDGTGWKTAEADDLAGGAAGNE